mmetsp:Transcript_86188/g.271822  ORF Transcript_86188/g.271822 Transcript_86188/m.271822 type:complete len:222 (-) Transcript_86188:135-800(-)
MVPDEAEREISGLHVMQKNTFLHILPPDPGHRFRRQHSAPPSISSDTPHQESDTSSMFDQLDNLVQPQPGGTATSQASKLESEEQSDDNSVDWDDLVESGRRQKRAPKGKRDRVKRFIAYIESKIIEDNDLDLGTVVIPPFILADERIYARTMERLAEFQECARSGKEYTLTTTTGRSRPAAKQAASPGSDRQPAAKRAAGSSTDRTSRPQRQQSKVLMSL